MQSQKYPSYHLFIEEVQGSKYHVFHCWKFVNDLAVVYTKNAGHYCWVTSKWLDYSEDYGHFIVAGYLPALLGQKYLKINK